MRRLRIIVPVALCLVAALVLLVLRNLSRTDLNAPKFIREIPQPAGPYRSVHYDWGGAVPFQGGKVWTSVVAGSNHVHTYLYDVDNRLVTGELFRAGPVFCNGDQSKLLCEGRGSSAASLLARIGAWIAKVSKGKIPLRPNQVETFWILDLRDNSATRVGELSQIAGTGSRWKPSPGFRYGYNVPSNREEGSAFYLCDLEKNSMTKIRVNGELKGWWDEQHIIIQDDDDDFVLFDITTRKPTVLFTAKTVNQFLSQVGLTNDSSGLDAFSSWNGHKYDIFFTPRNKRYEYGNSFLLEADKEGPGLALLYRNFKFEHLGFLDATTTHYLYNGESGTPGFGGNGGVFLRNLTNNTTRTLVEPDNRGQYALPRFYSNSVIYFSNRFPWRIDLDGSNNVPLLSP